jgi:uncharacterized protein
MTSRKKQFIAGAVCPSCSDMDSLVLYADDQSVKCVSCNYSQTSQQRDQESKKASTMPSQTPKNKSLKVSDKNTKYKDASLINIIQVKE